MSPASVRIVASRDERRSLVSHAKAYAHRLSNARSFGDRVALSMGTNVVLAALGVATGMLSARVLGPEGRGQLAAIQTWPTVLAGIAMLGLDSAVVHWTSRDRPEGSRYFASALALTGLVSAATIVLGWLLMPTLLSAQSSGVVTAARIFLLMVPIYAFIGIPVQMLRAVGEWRIWNTIRVAPAGGWLAALLVARYGIHELATPGRLSLLYLAGHIWLLIPVFSLARRKVGGPLEVRRTLFGPMLRFGLPDMFTVLPRMLNQRMDQLLMAAFLDSRTLGLYVVAVAWSGATIPLLSAIGPVLFPTLSATGDPQHQRKRLSQVLRATAFGATCLTVAVFVLTPAMLPLLFGEAYRAAIPAALVLVVAGGLNGVNLTLADGLRGLGRTRSILLSEASGLAVTCVLLLVLLRPFGALGAAITSLGAYAVVTVVLALAIRRGD